MGEGASTSEFGDVPSVPVVVGDTCSGCHFAALKQSIGQGDYQVIFASFHVDVSETPFFVAIDYDHQSVVVSIRGTISMKVATACFSNGCTAALSLLFSYRVAGYHN